MRGCADVLLRTTQLLFHGARRSGEFRLRSRLHTPEAAAQRISRYKIHLSASPFDPRQLFGCHRHQPERLSLAMQISRFIVGKCGLSEPDRRLSSFELPKERLRLGVTCQIWMPISQNVLCRPMAAISDSLPVAPGGPSLGLVGEERSRPKPRRTRCSAQSSFRGPCNFLQVLSAYE